MEEKDDELQTDFGATSWRCTLAALAALAPLAALASLAPLMINL